MENKIQITVENGVKELVIREGVALKIEPPQSVNIKGTINAPFKYLENRAKYLQIANICFLTVDTEKGEIFLKINEHSERPDSIQGKIEISKEVTDFDLANEKYRTPEDTANFLKRRKHLFTSEAEYTNIFTALRNFQAKVNQEIAAIKDDSGNYEQKRKQVVEHNIPRNFKLNIPLFKAANPIEIEVEFLVNKTLDVAMFSTDLLQKLDNYRMIYINEVISRIEKITPELLIMYV